MLCLTCTTITSIDLAHYGVSRAKDWVSVKCGTKFRWRDDLRFYVLFNSISVITGRWADDNKRLCAMEPSLWQNLESCILLKIPGLEATE